jgi:formylglycine-generating enzyme required for sulfatase activity
MTKLIIQRQRREAQYYTENLGEGISLDMILLPSGSFQMGTPDMEIEKLCKEYDVEYFQRESPQHRVNISSFLMGRYPITQAQWKAIASTAKIDIELKPEPSHFKDPYQEQDRWTRPIEQVSWYDAVEFCKRLSRETKREYRLSFYAFKLH